MRIRRYLTMALALLLAALVGCADLPTSGPVEQVDVVLEQPSVDIAPEPPVEGMTPEQLVDGFLLAMADSEADYAVARQYLTPEADDAWRPGSGAVIYDGELADDALTLRLNGRLIGRLDAHGRYQPEIGTLSHDFSLQLVDGQWRISAPPAGLMLSRFVFERYYSRVVTYFMSREGAHVVPDLVYQPESLVTPQRIVEMQLLGPSPDIAPAVTNAIGDGVELGDDGATINGEGVVVVDLEGLAPDMTEEARRRLGAQLSWSLTPISRVSGLRVMSNGAQFDLPGQREDGVLELSTQQGYQVLNRALAPDLYAIVDGALGMVTAPREFETLYDEAGGVAELAGSIDGTLAALVNADRRTLLLGTPKGRFTRVEHEYHNLRRPQFVQGELWVLAEDPDGLPVVLVVNAQGDVSALPVDVPPGHRLQSLVVAQTGVLAAAITTVDGSSQLGMMTVSGDDEPLVGQWRALVPVGPSGIPLTNIHEVDWQGETTLTFLASSGATRSVFLAQADGSAVEDLAPPLEATGDLTALPARGGGAVALHTREGAVWRYEARTRWGRVFDAAEVIAYAG
ncbi:MAG: LpqB family beta-propeller domain-containing protein [Tessaracoccus sp.]